MDIGLPYHNVRYMTAELLLELTQALKYEEIKRNRGAIGLSTDLCVSQEDIENMGEAMKHIAFYVPTVVFREAMYLAQENGKLILERDWVTGRKRSIDEVEV